MTEDRYLTMGECETTTEISCMGTVIMHPNTPQEVLLCLFDTPGRGDEAIPSENDYLISDLSSRMDRFIASRNDPRLYDDFNQRMSDERIHVCIYFLPPHKMNKLDMDHIRKLAPYVPIVVVVAKADTMTTSERNAYLPKVAAVLKTLNSDLKGTHGIRAIFNLFGEETASFEDITFARKSELCCETSSNTDATTELRRRNRGFKIELSHGRNLEDGSESEYDYEDDAIPSMNETPSEVPEDCISSVSANSTHGDTTHEEDGDGTVLSFLSVYGNIYRVREAARRTLL